MADSNERTRVDVGFEGGSTLTFTVPPHEADSLEHRLRAGDGGIVELDTDEGRLLVALGHVLYVRRHSRGSRVGFSARA
jgi:hypothetical protein